MKEYEITYKLIKGDSPYQKTIIRASDISTARRIFQQQNPGCVIIGNPREIR